MGFAMRLLLLVLLICIICDIEGKVRKSKRTRKPKPKPTIHVTPKKPVYIPGRYRHRKTTTEAPVTKWKGKVHGNNGTQTFPKSEGGGARPLGWTIPIGSVRPTESPTRTSTIRQRTVHYSGERYDQPRSGPILQGETTVPNPGSGKQSSIESLAQSIIKSTLQKLDERLKRPEEPKIKPKTNPPTDARPVQVIYNNYYNLSSNGFVATKKGLDGRPPSLGTTGVPTVGSNQQNSQGNASVYNVLQYRISDNELYNITETLFDKQALNASRYISLNLQNRSTSAKVTDGAKEQLFFVQPELLNYPTIFVTRALLDNYEHESHKKENRTMEKHMEENLLIDTFFNTNVMSRAMKWLADKRFIDPDDFETKDILRHIWFNHFSGTTCGFERVFASEKYDNTTILGVQDWLYFDYEESRKRIDYMGYTEKINLGNSSSLLKLDFQMDGIVRANTTIFVGTLPELEMSLYTICFYARPNSWCPVSLGGTKFNLYTRTLRYFGIDLIDFGIVEI